MLGRSMWTEKEYQVNSPERKVEKTNMFVLDKNEKMMLVSLVNRNVRKKTIWY